MVAVSLKKKLFHTYEIIGESENINSIREQIQKSLELDDKIAVRVPNNQCVLALLKECKLLVGTSANISGTASFNDPKECSKNLSGYDLLIDGGIISSKGESTIVEIEDGNVKILRKGSISEEEINELN